MLPAILNMPLPELAVLVLAGVIPLGLATLVWWLFMPKSTGLRPRTAGLDPAQDLQDPPLGLGGQWLIQERRVLAGIDRQTAAVKLHKQAMLQLGALDYEIDQLVREAQLIGEQSVAQTLGQATVNPLAPSLYTRRPNVPGSATSLRAEPARRYRAMAS
jgi:hypothetical protein